MPSRLRRAASSVLAALAGLAVLAACSNTTPSVNRRPHPGTITAGDVGAVEEVTIQATDTFRFVPSTIYVHAGKTVRVTLVHEGTGAPHNWSLNGFPAAFVPLISGQGTKATATFTAPSPGRYEFVCTIHVQAGQTGTLVVLP